MTCRYQPHSPAITLGHRGKVVRIVLDNTPSRRICAPTPPHPPVGARFIGETAAGAGPRRIGNNTAHRAESALLHLLTHPKGPDLSAISGRRRDPAHWQQHRPSRRICAPTPPHPPVGARFIGDTAAGAGSGALATTPPIAQNLRSYTFSSTRRCPIHRRSAAGAGARRIGNNTAHRAGSALLHLLIHP